MTNHVYLVVEPRTPTALERLFRPLHTRYAQRINWRMGWRGLLWQGRHFSSPLVEPCFWAAIRYVERNPVNTRLVVRREDLPREIVCVPIFP